MLMERSMLEDNRLSDDLLEEVSGGTMNYEMKDDPLYRKFSTFWEGKDKDGKDGKDGSGSGSRSEFISSFRQWVSSGMPEDITKRNKEIGS